MLFPTGRGSTAENPIQWLASETTREAADSAYRISWVGMMDFIYEDNTY